MNYLPIILQLIPFTYEKNKILRTLIRLGTSHSQVKYVVVRSYISKCTTMPSRK